LWRRNWPQLTPFFDYPPEIRKVIYTTNAIESVNMSLRKLTKHRAAFPSDEALVKLLYLALRNISKKWTMPIRDWKAALNSFTIQFEGRLPQLQTKIPLTQNSSHPRKARAGVAICTAYMRTDAAMHGAAMILLFFVASRKLLT
jgi:hypothetical protein